MGIDQPAFREFAWPMCPGTLPEQPSALLLPVSDAQWNFLRADPPRAYPTSSEFRWSCPPQTHPGIAQVCHRRVPRAAVQPRPLRRPSQPRGRAARTADLQRRRPRVARLAVHGDDLRRGELRPPAEPPHGAADEEHGGESSRDAEAEPWANKDG